MNKRQLFKSLPCEITQDQNTRMNFNEVINLVIVLAGRRGSKTQVIIDPMTLEPRANHHSVVILV